MDISAMTASELLLPLGCLLVPYIESSVRKIVRSSRHQKREWLKFDPSCRYCGYSSPENYGCCLDCAYDDPSPDCNYPCSTEDYALRCPNCQIQYEGTKKEKCLICNTRKSVWGNVCNKCIYHYAYLMPDTELSIMRLIMSTYNNGRFGELSVDESWQNTLGSMGSIASERQRILMEEHAKAEAFRQVQERLNPRPAPVSPTHNAAIEASTGKKQILDTIKNKVETKTNAAPPKKRKIRV